MGGIDASRRPKLTRLEVRILPTAAVGRITGEASCRLFSNIYNHLKSRGRAPRTIRAGYRVASITVLRPVPVASSLRWRALAIAERIAAAVLFAFFLPVILGSAALIGWLSGRSPWIAHQHMGWQGSALWMLKLRTMWGPRIVRHGLGRIHRGFSQASAPNVRTKIRGWATGSPVSAAAIDRTTAAVVARDYRRDVAGGATPHDLGGIAPLLRRGCRRDSCR